MKNRNVKQSLVIVLVVCFVLSSFYSAIGYESKNKNSNDLITENNVVDFFYNDPETKVLEFHFSNPYLKDYNGYVCVYVDETDFNSISDGVPVLPVKLTVLEFPLGTEILSVEYENSQPETMLLTKKLSFGKCSPQGTDMDEEIYESSNPFPSDWTSIQKGGGLSNEDHTTFLTIRVYPVRYLPLDDQIQYINEISVTVTYQEPDQPIIDENTVVDLLILAPSQFKALLQPLVDHKNDRGVKTILVELSDVYNQMSSLGRDNAEQIKYYIKEAIETLGVHYVLLVGGRNGQSLSWHLPVRFSHVVPPNEQEYAEESFISDLYYADIYDSIGDFSSWDSNDNNVFAEWNQNYKEEMDLYPDVYVGRLACRSTLEVKTMVNKIINYEEKKCDNNWFKNLVLVTGDAYNDAAHLNEGELISEEAINLMPGFTPVKVYAREDNDINRNTVKQAIDPGCGFAYFCGHGSPLSWGTHFPPDGTEWVTGFDAFDIVFLNNKEKLPILIIGGCHNNNFDVGILNLFKDLQNTLYHRTWAPRCWAWWFTVKIGGGAIASIGSTGLGTHGREDTDNNDIADYLEVLDGWLELYLFHLYGKQNIDILGKNHGTTITDYLHRFLGANEKMDVKMAQQWVLFGDPSLKIGGYE